MPVVMYVRLAICRWMLDGCILVDVCQVNVCQVDVCQLSLGWWMCVNCLHFG